jgi:hypothetical protein
MALNLEISAQIMEARSRENDIEELRTLTLTEGFLVRELKSVQSRQKELWDRVNAPITEHRYEPPKIAKSAPEKTDSPIDYIPTERPFLDKLGDRFLRALDRLPR